MLRLILAAAAALLTSCASTPRLPSDYKGPDAGHVVLGFGAAAGTSYSSYTLFFRRAPRPADGAAAPVGNFTYFQTNLFYAQKPDFQGPTEQGVVLVSSMPPGDYELFNFDIFLNAGTMTRNFGSRKDFSIPFTVRPGRIAYLGNYQANGMRGDNVLGISLAAGAVFAVSNRADSEITIARAKAPRLSGEVEDFTPAVAAVASPFFVAPRP